MDKLFIASETDFEALIRRVVREELATNTGAPAGRPDEPLTLSREDAAGRIGLKISKLDRLIKSGQLKSVKIGRNVRIRPSDIDLYLQSK